MRVMVLVKACKASESGTMPQTQRAVKVFALAHREDAGGRDDPIVPNNHAAVVERCLRKKDRNQELLRHVAINIHPALGKGSDCGISFYRQQRPDLSAGDITIGTDIYIVSATIRLLSISISCQVLADCY